MASGRPPHQLPLLAAVGGDSGDGSSVALGQVPELQPVLPLHEAELSLPPDLALDPDHQLAVGHHDRDRPLSRQAAPPLEADTGSGKVPDPSLVTLDPLHREAAGDATFVTLIRNGEGERALARSEISFIDELKVVEARMRDVGGVSIDGAGADVLRPRGRVREASGDVGP